ncbi:MAG: endo alpha-1,4 polygalactosaminidase [Phycisphaerales bacterium]|nr:endo alpha-1,4 polygalactosaminidase [Phycisphaerales bacterium]
MVLLLAASLATVAGCPTPNTGTTGDPNLPGNTSWVKISANATWQWQLQAGANGLNTSYKVDVYDIDLFDTPESLVDQLHADGRIVIAYFSAGSYEDFRDDAVEFQDGDLGDPLDGFADERWLDVRSQNVRRIMLARLDLAAAKGFDGVEPDNVTAFVDGSGVDVTAADQLDYNRFIAREAHKRGLAVGLKNDLEQIRQLVDDFDFAVNEQCHEFDECDALQPFIEAGKPVFSAEYADQYVNDGAARTEICGESTAQGIHTLVLPEDLDDSFRFSCGS